MLSLNKWRQLIWGLGEEKTIRRDGRKESDEYCHSGCCSTTVLLASKLSIQRHLQNSWLGGAYAATVSNWLFFGYQKRILKNTPREEINDAV